MPRLTDIWRSGIIRAPMARILKEGSLADHEVVWLPQGRPFSFLADPFAIQRNGRLFVFVEAFDYRDRIGGIDVLSFDLELRQLDHRAALREPWHLSYPSVIDAEGEIFMLPEAHRSGRLTLYRAVEFPTRWEPVADITLDCVPVDGTPFFFDGLWWLLYSPSSDKRGKVSRLHAAFAQRLTGPWHAHPCNPVRIDRASARPGGTPIIVDGCVVAPMQDCTRTYGGAIRPLRITRLTTTTFEAEAGAPIRAPASFAPFNDGFHTLSACGEFTLIDTKRIERSLLGLAIDLKRHMRRLLAVGAPLSPAA